MNYFVLFIAAFMAVLPPVVFVALRESVKRQRQEIIKDLRTVFDKPTNENTTLVIPSFEFVKYKYFLERKTDDADTSLPRDFLIRHWVVGMIPLILTCTVLNTFLIGFVAQELGQDLDVGVAFLRQGGTPPLFGWVVVVSYLGVTVFTLRAFFQAINNFDLSPPSFVGAWVTLILAILVALIFVFGIFRLSGKTFDWQKPDDLLFAGILITAFVVGYMPQLATRNIIQASQLRNYKREDVAVYKSFTAIPVEIIDGIDTEIRDRLADYHIKAVQNLAAANPLMLFVETPYGVYQIMDWVAQAQLCCSVGPSGLVQLWRLGIRTIFDLERLALDPACGHPELLTAVGRVLLGKAEGAPATTPRFSDAAIKANILMRLEPPHVMRLRQLFMRVGDHLADAKRLRPVPDCPAPSHGCPFAARPLSKAA